MLCVFVVMQNQFKSQGNPLIPSEQAEQALVYQRTLEAPNAQQKMSEQKQDIWVLLLKCILFFVRASGRRQQ